MGLSKCPEDSPLTRAKALLVIYLAREFDTLLKLRQKVFTKEWGARLIFFYLNTNFSKHKYAWENIITQIVLSLQLLLTFYSTCKKHFQPFLQNANTNFS